jgi:ribonucleoside-triphosphate reductase (thioredoxin)
MTPYQEIIHRSRYSRYLPELKRRETWPETVERLIAFLSKTAPKAKKVLRDEIAPAILNLDVAPSMRLLMTAGGACERENIAAYNCAYITPASKRSFSEALYVLMNGTGVGFSCEAQYVSRLPVVPQLSKTSDVIVVADSKLGWAKAFRKLLSALWDGDISSVDYSQIRPAGARLATFGGRASGPEALRRLFEFTTRLFSGAQGRRLTTLEVHDLFGVVGEVVVVGGVRRAALISLSDLDDRLLRDAKHGAWHVDHPERALANNSAVYTRRPDAETFLEEWTALVKSKSGERGIFNRGAAQVQAARFGRRDGALQYGCNPCSEIILRPQQFCNLTEVVVRAGENFQDIEKKVRLATILGTVQSTLTNFSFLSEEWKRNTEEERLLGVSLTGIYDNAAMCDLNSPGGALEEALERMRAGARATNAEYAALLGIPISAAITCVKPSGTVSQLVDSASGIHPRHAAYYIRRIRMDRKDPICAYLLSQGLPYEVDSYNKDGAVVFSFPQAAPAGAVTRNDVSALDHLALWLTYQRHWADHKPSATISVRDHEWLPVGSWVFEHFDEVSGLAFLPHSGHSYVQAPYEEISAEKYQELAATTPKALDWADFTEGDDFTTGAQTLACSAGNCDTV